MHRAPSTEATMLQWDTMEGADSSESEWPIKEEPLFLEELDWMELIEPESEPGKMPQWARADSVEDIAGVQSPTPEPIQEPMLFYEELDIMDVKPDLVDPASQPEFYDSGSASDEMQSGRSMRPRRAAASSSSSTGGVPGSGRRRRVGISARERNLRRLESNERERMRMHSLNRAFEGLRRVIPHIKRTKCLSKLETLTLATNYVKALTNTVSHLQNGRICYKFDSDDEKIEPINVLFRNENNILEDFEQVTSSQRENI